MNRTPVTGQLLGNSLVAKENNTFTRTKREASATSDSLAKLPKIEDSISQQTQATQPIGDDNKKLRPSENVDQQSTHYSKSQQHAGKDEQSHRKSIKENNNTVNDQNTERSAPILDEQNLTTIQALQPKVNLHCFKLIT